MAATTMGKGTTTRIVVPADVKLTPKQKKIMAVDAYEAAEAKAKAASTAKGLARDGVLDVAKHGEVITATSGKQFIVVDEKGATNQHEKVVNALVAKYDIPKAVVAKLYKDTAGSRHTREVKGL